MKCLSITIALALLVTSCASVSTRNETSSAGISSSLQTNTASSSSSQTNNEQPKTNNSSTAFGNNPLTHFAYPLNDAPARITKKPFGIYVSPGHSPVQPERFTGYHTGTDFETFATEKNTTVTAHAICDGTALYSGWVSGYGGVFIQSCTYKGQPVTVLYGHLNVDTITKSKGNTVRTGDAIGNLGQGYSHQTDGERKHLHVSVHKGGAIDFKGYVSTASQLSQWINGYPG